MTRLPTVTPLRAPALAIRTQRAVIVAPPVKFRLPATLGTHPPIVQPKLGVAQLRCVVVPGTMPRQQVTIGAPPVKFRQVSGQLQAKHGAIAAPPVRWRPPVVAPARPGHQPATIVVQAKPSPPVPAVHARSLMNAAAPTVVRLASIPIVPPAVPRLVLRAPSGPIAGITSKPLAARSGSQAGLVIQRMESNLVVPINPIVQAMEVMKSLQIRGKLLQAPNQKLAVGLCLYFKQRGFDNNRLAAIYEAVELSLLERIESTESSTFECLKILVSKENMLAVEAMKVNQLGTSIIYRGTTPQQALNILKYQTFGGVPPNVLKREPPTEEQASKQTGENVKDTVQGTLEEWSLQPGGLKGFATGGFMMVARVNNDCARFPPERSLMGEAGVTGWSDQSLLSVAILEQGKTMMSGQSPFLNQVDGFCKALGSKLINLDWAIQATDSL
jgi:hypothetical protein